VSRSAAKACFIVGYGNRQRRDDGIGPHMVERLRGAAANLKQVHLLSLPHLAFDTAEDLRAADLVLFVDASVARLAGGRSWRKLKPDMRWLPYLTHHVQPAFLLGLMEQMYGRTAPAWLVSVQGRDFGYGEGLSPEAARAAERVGREILGFMKSSRLKGPGSRFKAGSRFTVHGCGTQVKSRHFGPEQ